jgi:transcriptional regulator with XRE-family HTH domain
MLEQSKPAALGIAGARLMAKRIEPVDVLVGRRVRAYRLARGMSQTALGDKVGVTFQQIQKYESGTNRIGSSRLKKVATVLDVGIGALFAEQENGQSDHDPLTEILSQPGAARLLRAFAAITDKRLRVSLVRLAEGLRKHGSK